jgi:hypothetical protein
MDKLYSVVAGAIASADQADSPDIRSAIDAKAAGVIAIVSIGPNTGTAPAGRYRGIHVQSP